MSIFEPGGFEEGAFSNRFRPFSSSAASKASIFEPGGFEDAVWSNSQRPREGKNTQILETVSNFSVPDPSDPQPHPGSRQSSELSIGPSKE